MKAPLCKLEIVANKVLQIHCPEVLTTPQPIPVEEIMEENYHLHLRPVSLTPDSSILGETIFSDGVREVWTPKNIGWELELIPVSAGDILLDEMMFEKMKERTAFTEAHELGHWILHQECFKRNSSRSVGRWLEAEADTFASAFLLPRDPVRMVTSEFLQHQRVDWKNFHHFEKRKNQITFLQLAEHIAKIFGVSKATARIRMQKLFQLSVAC